MTIFNELSPWVIMLMVASCCLAALALAHFLEVLRRNRRRRQDQKEWARLRKAAEHEEE